MAGLIRVFFCFLEVLEAIFVPGFHVPLGGLAIKLGGDAIRLDIVSGADRGSRIRHFLNRTCVKKRASRA